MKWGDVTTLGADEEAGKHLFRGRGGREGQ